MGGGGAACGWFDTMSSFKVDFKQWDFLTLSLKLLPLLLAMSQASALQMAAHTQVCVPRSGGGGQR